MSDHSIALNRFGLGGRADDPPIGDPRRWLLDQMGRFDIRPAPIAALPGTPVIAAQLADYFAEVRMAARGTTGTARDDPSRHARQFARQQGRDFYATAAGARAQAALASPRHSSNGWCISGPIISRCRRTR